MKFNALSHYSFVRNMKKRTQNIFLSLMAVVVTLVFPTFYPAYAQHGDERPIDKIATEVSKNINR